MVSVNVEAFVLQEELLTDLEAQLEEDDDQGTSVSSTTLTDFWLFVQFFIFICDSQGRHNSLNVY